MEGEELTQGLRRQGLFGANGGVSKSARHSTFVPFSDTPTQSRLNPSLPTLCVGAPAAKLNVTKQKYTATLTGLALIYHH